MLFEELADRVIGLVLLGPQSVELLGDLAPVGVQLEEGVKIQLRRPDFQRLADPVFVFADEG